MSAIELTTEQDHTLARGGVVELPHLVVMMVETYRRTRPPRWTTRLLPDPPLEPVETAPPVELPFSGEAIPVAVTVHDRSRLLPDAFEDE